MSKNEWIQLFIYFLVLITLAPMLGKFMFSIFSKTEVFAGFLKPVENLFYKASGIDGNRQMNWKEYAKAILLFNLAGFLVLFAILLFQGSLPLNPENLPNVGVALAFNTAVSFVTNTNWQAYSGENTLSYFSQMIGLTVQNFVSAATGIAALSAMARGLTRRSEQLGNFWVDMTRSVIYILLPLSLIFAVIMASQGVVQTFANYAQGVTLEGAKHVIPLGPAASQIAIKQLGTNGGGFFGVNSAHPFENPTPFSNFLEMLAILLIPAALVFTYGHFTKSKRQGYAIFATMLIFLLAGLGIALYSEFGHNPVLGNSTFMEGKETRFGIGNSVFWGVFTSVTSNGSVNAMHDSFSPLAGMVTLVNLMLGEVIFGGVGSGLYGMLHFVILTVFIAGLMVGRTPEYLGKKIEKREVQMSMLAVMAPLAPILVFSSIAAVTGSGLSSLNNQGPHGLTEILYAFSSASGNNGSAFAGLSVNTNFYNITLAIAMLIGRYGVILPSLVIGGTMALKKVAPESDGTFSTDSIIFVVLLISVILIVGVLTFFPVITLGPILEHLLMQAGRVF
jgi:K+-transporting ATPase ATPase A chain